MSILQRAAWPMSGISAGVFAGLSALRGKRVFHPVGRAFTGVFTLAGGAGAWLPPPLIEVEEREAIVRMSRGAGLPYYLPDVLGLAVKIPDAYGPGSAQDWLLVTSGTDPVTRHSLIPAFDFMGRTYSSVLPYRVQNRMVTFGARPVGTTDRVRTFADLERRVRASELVFDFTIAPEGGDHEVIGKLRIVGQLSKETSDQLRFNPWNTHDEIEPAGSLNQLRRDAYRGSQAARPDS